VGTEHVYGVLVKQQIANSITNLVVYFLVFLSIYFSLRFYKKVEFVKKDYSYSSDIKDGHEMYFISSIALIVIFGIGVIFFMFTIHDTISGLINPEYGAIEKIVSMLK